MRSIKRALRWQGQALDRHPVCQGQVRGYHDKSNIRIRKKKMTEAVKPAPINIP
ncbi:MAG: hypothetical protein HZB80_11285 [Deltaproteobacteria bacterium]|nr:hypothetical protein [Deltaproteobacteria bacterium]